MMQIYSNPWIAYRERAEVYRFVKAFRIFLNPWRRGLAGAGCGSSCADALVFTFHASYGFG